MCLIQVKEIVKQDGTGYRLVHLTSTERARDFINIPLDVYEKKSRTHQYMALYGSEYYKINRWYKSKDHSDKKTGSRMTYLKYKAGFHIFKTKKAALKFNREMDLKAIVRKVEYKNAYLSGKTAIFGWSDIYPEHTCIVAEQMRIVEE